MICGSGDDLRSSSLRNVARRRFVVARRRFGTNNGPISKRQAVQEE